jgi:hypothetical protein
MWQGHGWVAARSDRAADDELAAELLWLNGVPSGEVEQAIAKEATMLSFCGHFRAVHRGLSF